jgi:Zinc dependent phospholipase C
LALCVFLLLSIALSAPQSAFGYATFTHLEMIDLAWKDSILPLILRKFPTATGAGMDEAHAYAYGGALIQDLGYYPFGKKFFSDLTHYVRSADFVRALLRNAKDADEFAFAIGALSHFVGDSDGHSEGIKSRNGHYVSQSCEKIWTDRHV